MFTKIKNYIKTTANKEVCMKHEILGIITRNIKDDVGIASIAYEDSTIEIRIVADEIPYEATVDVAASAIKKLQQLDVKAKQIAAEELTDTYNNGWSEYIETQEDGTDKTVSNPKLSHNEFITKLTLESITVTGQMLNFFYNNENMFWGHSVIVTSMDGVTFTDTHAEIFG